MHLPKLYHFAKHVTGRRRTASLSDKDSLGDMHA